MADIAKVLQGGLLIDEHTMTAAKTSDVLDVSNAGVAGLQFIAASATHVGTLTVELSIDGTNWDATSFRLSDGSSASSVAAANGSALAELVTVDVAQARRLRVKYAFTSGTGTLYVYGIAKSLSALSNLLATLVGGDLQIGAVEIKDATAATRAVVQAASSTVDTTVGLAVADGNMHTSFGAVGAAADPDGVIHGQLRSIAEELAAISADVAQLNNQPFSAATLVDALALTTTADESSQLSAGHYLIASDVDCYILQADSDAGTDLATYANGHLMPAGTRLIQVTGATNDYLAALVRAGTGVLTISGPF